VCSHYGKPHYGKTLKILTMAKPWHLSLRQKLNIPHYGKTKSGVAGLDKSTAMNVSTTKMN